MIRVTEACRGYSWEWRGQSDAECREDGGRFRAATRPRFAAK